MDKAVQVVLHEDSVKDIRDSINGQLLLEGLALIDKRAPRRFQQQVCFFFSFFFFFFSLNFVNNNYSK